MSLSCAVINLLTGYEIPSFGRSTDMTEPPKLKTPSLDPATLLIPKYKNKGDWGWL